MKGHSKVKGHRKVNLLIHGYDCNSNDQKCNYIKEIISSLDEVNEKSLCYKLISLWLQLHVHVHDNFLCTAAWRPTSMYMYETGQLHYSLLFNTLNALQELSPFL